MKTMTCYNYKRALKRLFLYMSRALDKGLTIKKASEGFRAIVNSYSGLNRDDRYLLYSSVRKAYRHGKSSPDWATTISSRRVYDSVLRACRKVYARTELRGKRQAVRSAMKSGTIFFLCSSHFAPAEDHAPYQGKVYVDRYWRQKVSGALFRAVLCYVKNRKICTVQDIMGAPVYMTTRPYCKHYFIPLDTKQVLGMSVRKLVELNGIDREKEWSPEEYFDLRESVFAVLEKKVGVKFKKGGRRI